MKTRVLLTGAASLLGAELLKELFRRPDVARILLLMPADEAIRQRDLARLEAYHGPMPQMIEVAVGNLRLPRFGLSLADWEEFATSFDIAIHCSQREVKDHDLELARQANLAPVETWIGLLSYNPELRLHHLSTAFVGGTRRGLLTEFDLECGQGFNNVWERSKFEAEVRLRESAASDRVTVYRPSHVLGRSDTGDAFQHGGAYPLLATLASSSFLPGDARARIDMVPVDYLAASMVGLACSGATGTFHLACGWNTSIPVRQAADLAAQGRGRSRGPRLLPRGVAWPLRLTGAATLGGLVSRGLAFRNASDLLHQGPVFDTYRADLALARLGITRPSPASWLGMVVQRAEACSWAAPPAGELDPPAKEAQLPAAAAEMALTRKNPSLHQKHLHQVGDVNVAYRDIGEGEPVVFFHGFAGAHAWDGVVERIAAHRRAIVIETFGLGDTEGPSSADFGLWAQAARARGLLSELDIPLAHIVGNDTGGVIAQTFAVRWPQCVKSLVLSDCDAHGKWPPTQVAVMATLMGVPGLTRVLTALMRIPAVARSRAGLGRMVYDKRLLTKARITQYLDAVAGSRDRRMRLKRFFRSFERSDLTTMNHMLGELQAPTMVIWGADNAYWSPSWAKTLYDAIPGARRLELIPFAGISCHEERPDLFAEVLAEFLDEIEAEIAVMNASDGRPACENVFASGFEDAK